MYHIQPNIADEDILSLDQIMTDSQYDLASQYRDEEDPDRDIDSPFKMCNETCSYYEPEQFATKYSKCQVTSSYFHLTCQNQHDSPTPGNDQQCLRWVSPASHGPSGDVAHNNYDRQ